MTLKLIVSMLLFWISGILVAQERYTVVAVKGIIRNQKDKQMLKQGSKLLSTDQIIFETINAAVCIVSQKRGRFVLKQSQREPVSLVRSITELVNNYCLGLRNKVTGTRSMQPLELLEAKDYFGGGSFVILGDTMPINIKTSPYPISDTTYFALRYSYRGNVITKMLNYSHSKLLLIPKKIFNIDNKPIECERCSQFLLMYYHQKSKKYDTVTSMQIVLLPSAELLGLVKGLETAIKTPELTRNQLIEEITDMINDMYGRVYKQSVTDWLNKHYKL